jgi:hypothetical protein
MEQSATTCSLCGKSFDSDRNLREHQQVVHAAESRERREHEPELDGDELDRIEDQEENVA